MFARMLAVLTDRAIFLLFRAVVLCTLKKAAADYLRADGTQ
jgi:hypothetical protein